MNDIYNQLFIMSAVAGGIYLILKFLSVITLKYFSMAWHYYTNIVLYMFFLLPYHRWVSLLNLPSIIELNPPITMNIPIRDLPQPKIYFDNFIYLEFLPYFLIAGTLIFLAVVLVQSYNLNRRIFRICHFTDDSYVLDVLSKCKQQIGIKGEISVYISPYMITPFIYGIVKPCIILPDIKLSEEELRCVFLHELTHWKRRDGWLKILMLFINAIHWFNPLAYAARLDIDQFCELSCDESVVKAMSNRERRRYCELMLNVLWNVADHKEKVLSAFTGRQKQLERRVNIILKDKCSNNKKWVKIIAMIMTLAMISIVVVGSVMGATTIMNPIKNVENTSIKPFKHQTLTSKDLYPVNKNGQTYGPDIYSASEDIKPDLIAAEGIDGTIGYVKSSDLNSPNPRTPEEAVAQNKFGAKLIPLYDKDGEKIIGQFKMETGGVIKQIR